MDTALQRCLLSAALVVMTALAQTRPVRAEASPPRAGSIPAPASFRYESIFSFYSPFREQPVIPWREANDLAGSLGGWRFYAREGQKPLPPPPPAGLIPEPAASLPAPVPGADAGRQERGGVK